jgi:hypothetical protein
MEMIGLLRAPAALITMEDSHTRRIRECMGFLAGIVMAAKRKISALAGI